jgi:hypothetical protein
MGVRSLGNSSASFGYKFGTTGLEAAAPGVRSPISATGGDATSTPGDGYKYHYFTTVGASSLVITEGRNNVEYIVIGGGGDLEVQSHR